METDSILITLGLSVPDSSRYRQYHKRITCRRTIKIKTDKSIGYKTQRNTVRQSCNHSAITLYPYDIDLRLIKIVYCTAVLTVK